ncbi:MAG: flavin reductase family protein [Rickettsiaceae bacterium]
MRIEEFKQAVGAFPTGVCVIATVFNNKLWGFTANSFVSISLSPPLISYCLDAKSTSLPAFKQAEYFAISVLANDQAEISRHFAQRINNKFSSIEYHLAKSGVPCINGAISFIECKKVKAIECGDHLMFIGEVIKTQRDHNKMPLLYFAKSYREISDAN